MNQAWLFLCLLHAVPGNCKHRRAASTFCKVCNPAHTTQQTLSCLQQALPLSSCNSLCPSSLLLVLLP